MNKLYSICVLFVLSVTLTSAFLMSDQGNNVRLANGTLLDYGNLTISIHDSSSGGNMIFNSTVQGAIINGSWNLMINPDVQYGQFYWKDYQINGEDLDFDGNERLQFQSSSGLINNVSFFNFSMIGSCSSGSAIKLVYSNGSVECESVSGGSNSTVDLTNYALKNQSETFTGNITTTQTGFFGWIGSLTSRITGLFVRDIDASGNVNALGNVSATYILGDGSLLTNLPAAGAESDPIFVAENSTLWNTINSKLSSSDQRYNDTVLVNSVNTNANIRSLGFYNISEINGLIAGINGGNSSFNQTLTDSLYYPINNPLNFVNSSQLSNYNETTLINSVNQTLTTLKLDTSDQRYNESLLIIGINSSSNVQSLGFYNISQINALLATAGNGSFNQSLTNSLYYSINNPINFINSTQASNYNDSIVILSINSSLWNYITANQAAWNFTFNETYNRLLGAQCPVGYLVNGTLTNGTLSCLQSAQTESDPLWAANSSLVLYINNLPLANRTISHINNITGFFFNYNQTSPANSYTNSVNSSIISWVDLFFARVANVFNKTEVQAQYYNKTEILNFGFVNSSGLFDYNDTNLINAINQTLSISKLNLTDQRYNETALVIGVNNTGNIQSLGFYNISQINALLSGVGNSSFNQSLTNTLYYSINNPSNFINSTLASAYNDSVLILSINSTIWSYLNSNQAGWNSTFNSSYNNLLGQQCSSGMIVNGTLSNGTLSCIVDSTGSSGNIFNQNLNTSSNVTFANVSASNGFFSLLGSAINRISRIFATDIDVLNNVSVAGNVSAQYYFGSLNRSTFPTSSCTGTDKVVSVLANGTVSCGTDQTGSGSSTSGTNFMNIVAGAVTDTNAPAAERIVGNSYYLVCTNATGYDSFRYGFARAATNGAANANVYIKYIAAPASTITGSSYTNLSTSGPQILSYTTANTATLSDFYTMDSNLGDICIAAFQAGGDGALDPQWRNIWVELS